jgi:hypothetical protein
MALHGTWQPSRTHSYAYKKAFKRLQCEVQAILPLSVVSVTSEMGRSGLKAVELLLKKIDGTPALSTTIPPSLKIRDSSR